MSDSENKTETVQKTEANTTAPYMKKQHKQETKEASSKSNIVIPLVLLLVSAIVIIATFYQEEYSNLLAQTDSELEAQDTSSSDVIAEANSAEASVTEISTTEAKVAETIATESIANPANANTEITAETTTEKVKASGQSKTTANAITTVETTQTEKLSTDNNIVNVSKVNHVANQKMPATSYMQHTRTPHQYKPHNRGQAQIIAKQRMEMMMQRRQAYEEEMRNRRAQYELAMKARQEKRENFAAAQKAVYQQAKLKRLDTDKKLQEIHNQISKLHEELHKIMRESRIMSTPAPMQSM